jgi:hypothetical protein
MDPRLNPYAPGAGTPPPELAGRDDLAKRAAVALDRVRAGRSSRSFIFYGLRGVEKTILLNRIRLELKAKYRDLEFGVDIEPQRGVADRAGTLTMI